MTNITYNAFVKKEFKKPEIKALAPKKRFKLISIRWKEEKKESLKKGKPVQTAVELAKEGKLSAKQAETIDDLQESNKFPLVDEEKIKPITRKEGETDGPGFKGEKHAIGVDSGILGSEYSFAGPGTKIALRLARGDKGVRFSDGGFSKIDQAAKIHDIEYKRIADKFKRTKGDFNPRDVRESDEKFVERVRMADREPNLRKIVLGLFSAKMKAEDLGILSPKKFVLSGGT